MPTRKKVMNSKQGVLLWCCPKCGLRMYANEKKNHLCATGHLIRAHSKRIDGLRLPGSRPSAMVRRIAGSIDLAYYRGRQSMREE